jgi:hypothetical protein
MNLTVFSKQRVLADHHLEGQLESRTQALCVHHSLGLEKHFYTKSSHMFGNTRKFILLIKEVHCFTVKQCCKTCKETSDVNCAAFSYRVFS